MNILSINMDNYREWNIVICGIQNKNVLHQLDLKQWFSHFSMPQINPEGLVKQGTEPYPRLSDSVNSENHDLKEMWNKI